MKNLPFATLLLISLYCIVAIVTFGFHHMWMTDTERLYYLPRALMFGRVAIEETRP